MFEWKVILPGDRSLMFFASQKVRYITSQFWRIFAWNYDRSAQFDALNTKILLENFCFDFSWKFLSSLRSLINESWNSQQVKEGWEGDFLNKAVRIAAASWKAVSGDFLWNVEQRPSHCWYHRTTRIARTPNHNAIKLVIFPGAKCFHFSLSDEVPLFRFSVPSAVRDSVLWKYTQTHFRFRQNETVHEKKIVFSASVVQYIFHIFFALVFRISKAQQKVFIYFFFITANSLKIVWFLFCRIESSVIMESMSSCVASFISLLWEELIFRGMLPHFPL